MSHGKTFVYHYHDFLDAFQFGRKSKARSIDAKEEECVKRV